MKTELLLSRLLHVLPYNSDTGSLSLSTVSIPSAHIYGTFFGGGGKGGGGVNREGRLGKSVF